MITKRRGGAKCVHLVCRARHPRGAALYSLVLLTTILVSAIGLAGLQLARVRGRGMNDASDLSLARTNARSALQLAICRMATDANWSSQMSGSWLTQNQAFNSGTLSISVTDPLDGLVSGTEDSLSVTGIGGRGRAVQQLTMRMNRRSHPHSCMQFALASASGIQVSQSTLNSTNAIATSGSLQANSSMVQANVRAGGTIVGSTIAGTSTANSSALRMPDTQHALDYYLQNGTAINLSALPKWQQTQVIRNHSFESDTSSWYALTDCNVTRSSSRATAGTSSLRVSGRSSRDDSAAQDLTLASIKNGNTYRVSVPFFPTANGTASARITLQSTGDGTQIFQLPNFACAKNAFGNFTWILMEGDLTLSWSGTLTKATLSFDTSFSQEFYIDSVSLTDVTYPQNMPVIDHQLISPTVNPFGATNVRGIYVIYCGNQDLMIGRSRLVGTFVLVSPGANSCLDDYVNLEPAIPGFPSLLVNGDFKFAMNGDGLSEVALGMNLNPTGTPYPFTGGISNGLVSDNYPNMLTGLIYATGSLTITGQARIHGVVLAHNSMDISSAHLSVQYDDQYAMHPPPGFQTLTYLRPHPGTVTRSVN